MQRQHFLVKLLVFLRRITPLSRRDAVYFYSGVYTGGRSATDPPLSAVADFDSKLVANSAGFADYSGP
jgi:hypothetical protein